MIINTEYTKVERKIMNYFFNYPNDVINTRELANKIGFSHTAIAKTLDKLSNMKLVLINKTKLQTEISLNQNNKIVFIEKRLYNIKSIYYSGIVDYLEDIYEIPKSIVLFGSYALGEDNENSDIDIAVETSMKNKKTNFKEYEKKLNRKIELFFIDQNTPNELLKSIYNGIVLRGSL